MGRSLRIPGLLDLLRVDARSDIRGLAERRPARPPLRGARAADQPHSWCSASAACCGIDGAPLPSVAPRQDAQRARAQDGSAAPARSRRRDAAVGRRNHRRSGAARCAATAGAPALGPAAQQAVGRLFVARLHGQPARAGPPPSVLDAAVHTRNPLRAIFLQLSGAAAARRAGCSPISSRRSRRGSCHRHRRAQSRARLRAHARAVGRSALAPACRPTPSSSSACSRRRACCARRPCRAPPSPARCARARSSSSSSKPRAQRTPGRDVEFMTGTWAQCPAAAFVPALLRVVWERAVAAPATGRSRAQPIMSEDRHLHAAQVPQPDGQEPHLPLEHLRAGSTTRTARSRRPASTGNASSPPAASARSSRPTCRC